MAIRASFLTFVDDRKGATAIEYGLLSALLAVFLIAILTTVGTQASTVFGEISSTIK